MASFDRQSALLSIVFLAGCGSAQPTRTAQPAAIGTSQPMAESAPQRAGFELTLRRADGSFIDVGELRGRRVLLYIFATFDAASQAGLTPLTQLAEAHEDLAVIAIAAQPNPRLLVDAYEHSLAPPFPITYDPEDAVALGESALGEIEGVPSYVLIDEEGELAARQVGLMRRAELEAFLRSSPSEAR